MLDTALLGFIAVAMLLVLWMLAHVLILLTELVHSVLDLAGTVAQLRARLPLPGEPTYGPTFRRPDVEPPEPLAGRRS